MPSAASLAVIVAAVLAALTRWWLARLPEPAEPDEDKVPYAALARSPFLALLCAVAGAVLCAVAVWQLPEPLVPVWTVVAAMVAAAIRRTLNWELTIETRSIWPM